MEELIEAYFRQFDFLGEVEIAIFKKNVQIREFQAGEKIQEAGRVHNRLSIVLLGIVRMYHMTESGADKTIWIADEGSHIGDPVSVFEEVESDITIEAIEPCLVASFIKEELDKVELDHPRIMLHKAHTMKLEICEVWNRMRFFALMNPEERFIFLKENRPRLFDRVQQKHLASYIGVTDVSFTRIKKRLE